MNRTANKEVTRRDALGALLLPALLRPWPAWAGDAPPADAEIARLIEHSGAAEVGVAYHNLAGGHEILIHADTTFHAASTMKVPVLMEIFRQAEEKIISLDDKIAVTNGFHSIVDGSPYALKPEDDSELTLYRRPGERISIRELSRLMITESSNLATNLLIERVSAAKVTAFMDRLGAKEIRVLRGVEDGRAYARGLNNTLTARSLMTILVLLAKREVVSRKASDEMLAILRGQKFNEGIPAGLPAGDGATVAHKTGSFQGVYHDAAIVEPPGRQLFVLVVLTRGIHEEKRAHKLVADIARAVYQRA